MRSFTPIFLAALLICLLTWAPATYSQPTDFPLGVWEQVYGYDLKRTITTADLPTDKPILVFYFDPYCDHCTAFADQFAQYEALHGKMTVLWITWTDDADINYFLDAYPFLKKDYQFVLRDFNFDFDEKFGYSELPCWILYNANRKLIKKYQDAPPTEEALMEVIK